MSALKFLAAMGGIAAPAGDLEYKTFGTASTKGTTSISVNYDAGDFVIVLCGHKRGNASWAADTAFLSNSTARIGTGLSGRVFWGTASSSGSSVSITESANVTEASSYIAMVFSGVASSDSATATSTSANPNPPSLSGFATDDICVAMVACDDGVTITAMPSGYTEISNYNGTLTSIAAAYKIVSSETEDPGTFTQSASDTWTAFTMRLSA